MYSSPMQFDFDGEHDVDQGVSVIYRETQDEKKINIRYAVDETSKRSSYKQGENRPSISIPWMDSR